MPIFEYSCADCGSVTEVLVMSPDDTPRCGSCQSLKVNKLISAHSSASGLSNQSLPGASDTSCCGSTPGMAHGCAGPGSCCGKGGF